jgi:hypothetical protein
MLWVYGAFSKMEKICSNSFVQNKYNLNIWSYGGLDNAPLGAYVRDAREIIPENSIFKGRSGSYAQFSDLFRYAVLCAKGGLWADTDVVCLKAGLLADRPFLVTERDQTPKIKKYLKTLLGRPEGKSVTSNLIYNPEPAAGNVVDLAYQYAQVFPKEKVVWGELGPRLLAAIESIYPEHGFEIKAPNFANAVDWWLYPGALLSPGLKNLEETPFLHLYNETWRRAGIDKNAAYPVGSLMKLLEERFLY